MRARFAGWARADSVVLNPHKWMGTPVDCSVLLFRDPGAFRASLALSPAYLRTDVEGVTNLMDYGLSLGRRFRALKLWFLFWAYGLEGLRTMLRRHIGLARRFAERIGRDPRFELAAPVSFSTVCFRAVPGRTPPEEAERGGESGGEPGDERAMRPGEPDGDELNRKLLEGVNREGKVFLSRTSLEGRYTLRFSVGGVHTTRRDVDAAFESLARASARLDGPTGAPEHRGE